MADPADNRTHASSDPGIARLLEGRHHDPFAVLGRHPLGDGRVLVRVFAPEEAADGFAEYIIGMPGEHAVLVLSVDAWTSWDYAQG